MHRSETTLQLGLDRRLRMPNSFLLRAHPGSSDLDGIDDNIRVARQLALPGRSNRSLAGSKKL